MGTGYQDCACRDCPEIVIANDGEPTPCDGCAEACCDLTGKSECLRDDDFEELPPCAASMGCLCAGHARGNPADAACDTSELAEGEPS